MGSPAPQWALGPGAQEPVLPVARGAPCVCRLPQDAEGLEDLIAAASFLKIILIFKVFNKICHFDHFSWHGAQWR